MCWQCPCAKTATPLTALMRLARSPKVAAAAVTSLPLLKPVTIAAEDLEMYLVGVQQQDSAMYIALHADEDIAYKEVVRVLDIANEYKMKLVVATKK